MRTNTSPLFYKCGILKFVDLIAYKTLIVMFKVKNNLLPIGIQSLFKINSNSYNTRQSGEFNQKYVRTTMKSLTVIISDNQFRSNTFIRDGLDCELTRYRP